MSNFLLIFRRELRETLRSRFFRTTSVIFGLILLLALAVLLLINLLPAGNAGDIISSDILSEDFIGITDDQSDELENYTIMIDDRTGSNTAERLNALVPLTEFVPCTLDSAAIRTAFESGAAGCIIIRSPDDVVYYLDPFEYHYQLNTSIEDAFAYMAREDALMQHGLSQQDAAASLAAPSPLVFSEVSHSDLIKNPNPDDGGFSFSYTDSGTSISVFIISTLLFSSISFYGQMVSSRVASEKSTRMIEVLATSASPAELLCGKVLGVGTAGFLQVSVFYTALLALGGAALHRLSGLSDYAAGILSGIVSSAAQNMGAVFLYLLLGFFQLAFIYGGIGAMSTDNDSVSGFAAIPLQLPSIGYMIAMLAPSISGSALLNAASYIPLVAPFAMPARLGVSEVSLWEVLLSLIIQFSFIALTAVISAKLYRRCMLRYGQPPKIREIFSIITSRSRT